MRRALAAAIVCVLGLAGAAQARPAFHSLGPVFDPPATPAGRYVLWTSRFHGIDHLLDTRTGRRSDVRGTKRCSPADDAGTFALLGCDVTGTSSPVKIVDAARRAVIATPAVRPGLHFFQIGRQWLLGSVETMRGDVHEWVYRNWHTGKERTVPNPNVDDRTPPADRNLDDPALGPASQPPPPRGYHLRGVRDELFARPGHAFTLWKGTDRVAVVSSCPKGCTYIQLRYGIVVWREGQRIRAYVVSSGARWTWPYSLPCSTPGGRPCDSVLRPSVLRRHILLDRSVTKDSIRLYIARWR